MTKHTSRQLVSIKELSEWLNLTPRRIQQLVKRGVIPKNKRGLYPLQDAVRSYIVFIRKGADKPDLIDWRNGDFEIDWSEFGG